MIFLGDFSFVRIFLKNYRVTMTTTLDTSCSENTMVLSARRGSTSYPGSFFGKDPGSGWSRGSHFLGAKLTFFVGGVGE